MRLEGYLKGVNLEAVVRERGEMGSEPLLIGYRLIVGM